MDLATLFGSLTLGHGVLGVALIAVYHLTGWVVSKWSTTPSVTPAPQTSLAHDALKSLEGVFNDVKDKAISAAWESIIHPALAKLVAPPAPPAK